MGSLVMNDALVARDPLHSSSSWMNPGAMRSGGALDTVQQQRSTSASASASTSSNTYETAFNPQRRPSASPSSATTTNTTTSTGTANSSSSFSSSSSSSQAQQQRSTHSSSQSTASNASSTSTIKPSSGSQAQHRAATAATPPSPQIAPSAPQNTSSQLANDSVGDVPPAPASNAQAGINSGMSSNSSSSSPTLRRIKVKDLQHIQAVARQDPETFGLLRPQSRSSHDGSSTPSPQFEISEMPVADVIEMVAGLLTKITTTNDRQHEHLHRNPIPDGTTTLSQQTSSVLSFHGKNVPSITILSYLSRIHKYCPTTYEIFLSLLVYFDRMTERVNSGPLQSLRQASQQSLDKYHQGERATASNIGAAPSTIDTPPSSAQRAPQQQVGSTSSAQEPPSPPLSDSDPFLSHFFVVDSYNIHRLVIAGVTCASKFFSDVFYTNSRYAKVGGLPLVELNHLELQFLLLNDFRLSIPVEELEAYATMLVEFYAREVVAQQIGLP